MCRRYSSPHFHSGSTCVSQEVSPEGTGIRGKLELQVPTPQCWGPLTGGKCFCSPEWTLFVGSFRARQLDCRVTGWVQGSFPGVSQQAEGHLLRGWWTAPALPAHVVDHGGAAGCAHGTWLLCRAPDASEALSLSPLSISFSRILTVTEGNRPQWLGHLSCREATASRTQASSTRGGG